MTEGPSTQALAASTQNAEHPFLERVRRAFEMLLLRADAIDDVLGDDTAFLSGLAIVALAGVASAVGSDLSIPGYVGLALLYVVASVVLAGIVHLAARLVLGASAEFMRFYRAFAHSYLILWITGIPVIQAFFTWALAAWMLAVVVYIAERCYRLERVQAVAVVGIPVVALFVLAGLVNGVMAVVALVSGWLF